MQRLRTSKTVVAISYQTIEYVIKFEMRRLPSRTNTQVKVNDYYQKNYDTKIIPHKKYFVIKNGNYEVLRKN